MTSAEQAGVEQMPGNLQSDVLSCCPVCSSTDLTIYIDDDNRKLSPLALGPSRRTVSPGRILRCRSCGLGFRQSRPSDDELVELYSALDGKVYDSEGHGRANTAARHLGIVHRFQSTGRLLDVGCASGSFLRCAADAGWTVIGIEPAAQLCAEAKVLLRGRGEVFCATLQTACLPAASFDAVTLWDVLEHVADPIQFLVLCRSLLKPGGCLFVNVPDLDSVQAKIFRARWPLLLAEHLTYFNHNSIRVCAERAGLQWRHFGRRPVSFSVQYVLYRLAQHRIPGASTSYRLMSGSLVGESIISLLLGELYGVWTRLS